MSFVSRVATKSNKLKKGNMNKALTGMKNYMRGVTANYLKLQ
jgi:hypothetical protein